MFHWCMTQKRLSETLTGDAVSKYSDSFAAGVAHVVDTDCCCFKSNRANLETAGKWVDLTITIKQKKAEHPQIQSRSVPIPIDNLIGCCNLRNLKSATM